MTDPITLITNDHATLRDMFSEYMREPSLVQKEQIVDKLLETIEMHTKMEEKHFYPAIKDASSEQEEKIVEKAIAEHHAAKVLVTELKVLSIDNPQFEARLNVLKEDLQKHMSEEESVMLPLAKKYINASEMEDIGKRMKAFKEDYSKTFLEKMIS